MTTAPMPRDLAEFSVVFTDRALNHMSQAFQEVMRDLSTRLKAVYRADGVALIPGGGTYAMEAVARQLTGPGMAPSLVIRNGWFSFRWSQILESIGADYIDESEVLTPADEIHHINKHKFGVPFVCGCRDLGEALRRVAEGAAMIRTKGEAGTGNVVEAVRHCRSVQGAIKRIKSM